MAHGASLDELRKALRAAGARPLHETLILRAWVRGLELDAFARTEDVQLSLPLRRALPQLVARFGALLRIVSEHRGADDSVRFLLALGDGKTIESVLLPGDGVCISTQVGCAVGCTFCMTGRAGLERHLTSGEILAQVALARARRSIRRVVFMGMGEPAHNLDNVLEAIGLLGAEGDLAQKNLVFSTVGDRRAFERLPQGPVRPALALSLHTTKAELRTRLLPRAPRIEPAELIALADAYSRATKYPTQYQWTLLEGVNDGDDELHTLATLLAGHYAVVNFIPYNTVDGTEFRRPSWERATEMARYLHRHGVLAKLRRSAGQDVEGGCGQLRARQSQAARITA
jgi:23S rRNA (adenine2503-C2)-methyltransferase